MCGIAGLFSYAAGEPVDAALLARMNASLVHRGPDDEGSMVEEGVGLAMRRLAIIDLTTGHQPIGNEDGSIAIVFNGEIYNFRELRTELEAAGHRFRTRSDTEVIVHAYEEWGDDCPVRLNGIFAFSIWDRPRRRILLARDHYGVKPLYFHDDGRRIAWASEIKALLADERVPRRVDPVALEQFLTFRFVPSPRTMFDGIAKLAPGHRLVCDARGPKVERYWQPRPVEQTTRSMADLEAELQARLETAVSRQMISDVPVGALLSGGIDSAVVVALMTRASGLPVRTFTIGFAEGGAANEIADARATARLFNTEHHDLIVDRGRYLDLLGKAVYHLDEPIATSSALAVYLVCELARPHVKVVLTGQGADEPLAGYHRYYAERYGHLYRRLPAWVRDAVVRPAIERLPRGERLKRAVRSLGTEDVSRRFAQVYAVFDEASRRGLWRNGHAGVETAAAVVDYWRAGVTHLDPLGQMTYVDARLSLADDLLMNGDKMSMAASVEARVPFLDLDYMAFVESLPPAARIHGLTRKYLHKRAVARWLPDEIVSRTKRGFDTPIDQWFRSEVSRSVRRLIAGSDAACGRYFEPRALGALLDDHVSGRQDHRRQIFSLLMFELWHRTFIERQPFAFEDR